MLGPVTSPSRGGTGWVFNDKGITMIIEQSGWRVIEGDYTVPQWVLQRKTKGGWKNRSYCQTRKALIRDFRRALRGEHDTGEDMTPETLDALTELPERIDG